MRNSGEEREKKLFFHLPQENRGGKPSPNKTASGSFSISGAVDSGQRKKLASADG